MTDFISGDISTNPGLKIAALNSILATEKVDSIWKNNHRKNQFIIWRYLATEAGVVRIYPGVRLQQSYDHKLRAWYRRTIANRYINVISAPYNDLWGAGKVISISRTIHIKWKEEHSHGKSVEAVIAGDVSVFYFYQLILKMYSVCNDRKYVKGA